MMDKKRTQALHLKVFGLSYISGFVSVLTSNSAHCVEKQEFLRYIHCKSSEVHFYFICRKSKRLKKKVFEIVYDSLS